jgi:hypothetical protein
MKWFDGFGIQCKVESLSVRDIGSEFSKVDFGEGWNFAVKIQGKALQYVKNEAGICERTQFPIIMSN